MGISAHKKAKRYFKPRYIVAAPATFNLRCRLWKIMETKNRKILRAQELHQQLISTVWRDLSFSTEPCLRKRIYYLHTRLSTQGSISRLKNFCQFIGRGRANLRSIGMARHTFYQCARQGLIFGISNLNRRH